MKTFPGFSESETSTAIPDSFFNVLLRDVQDEDELKVILYALWRLERMEGTYPGLAEAEFVASAAGMDAGHAKAGLEKAVQRGALVRARHEAQTLYFLNSARGRLAAQAFAERGPGDSVSTASLPLERPNVFRLYEENIGPLTPLIADALKDAEAAYAPQWIAEAIELAVEHNKRSWKYCEAILKRWKEEGRGQKQTGRDDQAARRRDAKNKIKRFLEG
jgi:DnaD/phage-associated family protein